VTLDQALSSDLSKPGDRFDATVSEPVVMDGKTVILRVPTLRGGSLTRGNPED